MVRRYVVTAFALVVLLTLLVGTAGAGTVDSGDVGLSAVGDDGEDAHVLERLRASTSSVTPNRLDADGVLEQSTRAEIYRALRESPGASLAGLATVVGVTKSTVRYHVDVLRRAGIVDTAEIAGEIRVAASDGDVEVAAARSADATGRILDAVAEHEPASVTAIASATDRAPSTVSHHLAALEERGIVERERAGEAVLTTLAPSARAAMSTEEPLVADD